MPESQNIEYKSVWRDEYLKWVCGFANANGGTIVIGKDDSGKIIGVADSKKLLEDIPNKVKDVLGILVDVNLHQTKKGNFIEIVVEAYPYPVNYKGQYHYRSGSTKQELKGAALDKFLLQKKGKHWDGVPLPLVAVKDLKKETFDFFRKRAFKSQRIEEEILTDSDDDLLENLQLKENSYLKRAAILLFHPNPEKYITGAYIKIGFFESDDDLRFQDEIHGNLVEQAERSIDLLFTKYIRSAIRYDGISRIETFEYPKEAIREALLNAIAHKDYSGATPIQISVYKNKLIFWNEGQLPENWTINNLLVKHPSKPFNPDIANALFRSGYIESWGRGTLKMIRECAKAGIPDPVYYFDMSGFFVEFTNPVIEAMPATGIKLNKRQVDALSFYKAKGEIRITEYIKKYKITDRTARRDLAELVTKGFLVKTGTTKTTKYIFTGS